MNGCRELSEDSFCDLERRWRPTTARACRGRSGKEFCAKLGLVAEESDESLLWLELLLVGSPGSKGKNYDSLLREADELTAIFSASYKTARANLKKEKRERRSRERKSPNHQIP